MDADAARARVSGGPSTSRIRPESLRPGLRSHRGCGVGFLISPEAHGYQPAMNLGMGALLPQRGRTRPNAPRVRRVRVSGPTTSPLTALQDDGRIR